MRLSLRNQKVHSFLSRSPPSNPFDNHRTYRYKGLWERIYDDTLTYIFLGTATPATPSPQKPHAWTRRWKRRRPPPSTLRFSPPISLAGPSPRLPMPALPAPRES